MTVLPGQAAAATGDAAAPADPAALVDPLVLAAAWLPSARTARVRR